MLETRHLGRNEDSEMTDVRIGQVDDALARRLEIRRVLVNGGNPSQGLMGRGDVVAVRRKDDQRVADAAQVGRAPLADAERTLLQLVPNEQIFGFINEVDRNLIDEAMRARTILCSPLSLYAILAVIRQAMDNFSMESKSKEMLSYFGAFKVQWEKFKDQMKTVQERFESVHKGYEELVGARERQLDRPLNKIDELRADRGIEPAPLDTTIKKVTRKELVQANH